MLFYDWSSALHQNPDTSPSSSSVSNSCPLYRSRLHNYFSLPVSPSLSHLRTSLRSFLALSPFSLHPSPSLSSWDVSHSRGSVLTPLHSASGTSASTFPPVHHCLPPQLCIKYQAPWKGSRGMGCRGLSSLGSSEGNLKGISPRLMIKPSSQSM